MSKAAVGSLTLTVEEINLARLHETPAIRSGDALVFEANRTDFVLEIYLSSGREIVTQPGFPAEAENTATVWRKGRAKLDYAQALTQHIVGMKVTALHQTGTPLLLKGIKIDRLGEYIFELEKTYPGSQKTPEVPTSYPQDPRVVPASITRPDPLQRKPETGFLASRLPAFSMQPMMFQSTGTSDGNHYKYNGKELDDETGLYYYGARHYSPALGRFISPDWSARPVTVPYADLSNPQTLNLYNFGRNNPLSMRDPDGHCPDGICINIAAKSPAQIDHLAKATPQVMIGQGKSIVNAVTSTANMAVNVATHGGTYIPGSTPEIPQLKPTNEAQAAGMITMNGALVTTGVVTGGLAIVDLTSTVRAASVIESTTVMHFTSDAGVAGITDSGGLLRTGTYVTAPGEIPAGATSTQIENLLEIGPGKGQNSITFETPTSNLTVPENGPSTSGGAQQFQLKQPTQVDPTKFKKPGGGS